MALFDGLIDGLLSTPEALLRNFTGQKKKSFINEADYKNKIISKEKIVFPENNQGLVDNIISNNSKSELSRSNQEDLERLLYQQEIDDSHRSVNNQDFVKKTVVDKYRGEYSQIIDKDLMPKLLQYGFSSPNKYRVEFHLPKGVVENPPNNAPFYISDMPGTQGMLGEQVTLMCSAAELPSKSFLTTEHRHNNLSLKLPYMASFDDVTFTFYASDNMLERAYFEAWMATVYNTSDGTLNFYDEYVGNIIVKVLDRNQNTSYEVKLYEAYPVSMNAVNFSYGSSNEVTQISIGFAYRYWDTNEFWENPDDLINRAKTRK